jgi:2-dehydro-3-deoxy-D-gluconate 5-dehydrogenase
MVGTGPPHGGGVMGGNSFRLDGKVALVTGGGRGLGRGIALALAEAGATVVATSRTAAQLEEVAATAAAAGATLDPLPADLGDGTGAGELVDGIVQRHGHLDVLVHAAGNMARHPAEKFPAEDFDQVIGLHLRAAFLLAQAAGRHMIDRGEGGSIIFIGSLTSQRLGARNALAYAAAKSGLLGMMRVLAVEWGEHRIRVNTIAPGFFKPTELTADVDQTPGRKALHARVPMGFLGELDELGGTAVYLAADASRYVTGEVITVDGGWSVA